MAHAYALTIGLNTVDPGHYAGWSGVLNACENDAKDMAGIAESLSYDKIQTLLSARATRDAVLGALKKIASQMQSGDYFLLTYSGHGGQLPDLNSDEQDGLDETWCLYDGELIDDEIIEQFALFPEETRIFVLSDSCHSGTVVKYNYNKIQEMKLSANTPLYEYRFMPTEICIRTYKEHRAFYEKIIRREKNSDVQATVRLLSGCQDNQFSADGPQNGLFTGMLLRVWNSGKFKGNYADFYREIVRLMPPDQTPNHLVIGKRNPSYDRQRPFEK